MNMKLQILSCSIALALCQGAVAQQKNADTPSSPSTSAPATAGKSPAATSYNEADYSRSMERLQKAAQGLREAVQAMATQPAGEGRNEAMRQANDALVETQKAMVQLPPELRKAAGTDASGGSGGSGKKAASAGSSAAKEPSATTINAKVPVLVMVPVELKMEDHAKGCWAKVYDKQENQGDSMTLLGPLNLAQMRASLGFSWENMIESVETGPKAQLTIYDNENFRDRAKIIEPGKKVADLDEKLGFFENIRSMKVSCT
jgi:hypothetical protein